MFQVKDASTRETLPGFPSPLLIQTGYGEAYPSDDTDNPFWRLRDDKYDPPGTVYRKVSIVHVEEYWVDVEVTKEGAEDDPYYPYADTVRVVAASADAARAPARDLAIEYAKDRDDEDADYRATVLTVKKEF